MFYTRCQHVELWSDALRCVQSTVAMAVPQLLARGLWAPGGTTFWGAEDPSLTAFLLMDNQAPHL